MALGAFAADAATAAAAAEGLVQLGGVAARDPEPVRGERRRHGEYPARSGGLRGPGRAAGLAAAACWQAGWGAGAGGADGKRGGMGLEGKPSVSSLMESRPRGGSFVGKLHLRSLGRGDRKDLAMSRAVIAGVGGWVGGDCELRSYGDLWEAGMGRRRNK